MTGPLPPPITAAPTNDDKDSGGRLRAATRARELVNPAILPRLDPDFVRLFVDVLTLRPAVEKFSIEEVRAHPEWSRAPGASAVAASAVASGVTQDFKVVSEDGTEFAVRVYRPDAARHGAGPWPVHVNFHGGGFVTGDLLTDTQLCLSMTHAGVVVVDVDYRLCPENVWGKCIQDAWAALQWARASLPALLGGAADPGRGVSIGGVSAGGHISLVLHHLVRDAGVPLQLCMAAVPTSTDCLSYGAPAESAFGSFREFAAGPVLPWTRIAWYGKYSMGGGGDDGAGASEQRRRALRAAGWPDWWLAPLRAPDWRGLSPLLVRTAECDPLRDEAEAYAERASKGAEEEGGAGAGEGKRRVKVKRYMGAVHSFMYYSGLKQKAEVDRDAIEALRQAHGLD